MSRKIARNVTQKDAYVDKTDIKEKALEQNIHISAYKTVGNNLLIRLSKPAEKNAIRRFKNHVKISNPRIERIEVRQPKGEKPIEKEQDEETLTYENWKKKMLRSIKKVSGRKGWNVYRDPVAGKNTDYILLIRGEGENKQFIKLRLSEHPEIREQPDISMDMYGQEMSLQDFYRYLQSEG